MEVAGLLYGVFEQVLSYRGCGRKVRPNGILARCLELVVSSQANSAEPVQSTGPQLHIRSARELFGALESSDGLTRLAVLQAVQKAPVTALSFGLHARRDLIDVLISQAEHFRGEWEWFHWVGALAAFRDPRVVRLFTSLITNESH